MKVGICVLELLIFGSRSLKDKRQVVKSLKDRIRHQFNVSIAEVDAHDLRQRATLGIACVACDTQHANSVLSNVINFVEQSHVTEINHYEIEII